MWKKITACLAKVDTYIFRFLGHKLPPQGVFTWRNRLINASVLIIGILVLVDYARHGMPAGMTVLKALGVDLLGMAVLWLGAWFVGTLYILIFCEPVIRILAFIKAMKEGFIPACKAFVSGIAWLGTAMVRVALRTPAAIWAVACWLVVGVLNTVRAVAALPAAIKAMNEKQWEGVLIIVGVLGGYGISLDCLWAVSGHLAPYLAFSGDALDIWANTLMIDFVLSGFGCLPILAVWAFITFGIMHLFCRKKRKK